MTTASTPCTDLLDTAIAHGQLGRDPYPMYADLRERDPVCRSHRWGCWVVSRSADVAALLRDTRRLSSTGRVINAMRQNYSEEDQRALRPLLDHYSQGLIHADPPDHTRLRRLVQAAFLPRTLDRLTPRVEAIVADLLDRIAARGRTDWIADLAYPLPVTVIAELLGVPAAMHAQFKAWSQGIVAFMASPRPDVDVALGSQAALLELRAYFRTVFDQRRREPGEDLISNLVNVHLEGDALSEEELLSTCVTILIGGHETTTSLLGSAAHLLATRPELADALRREPALMPAAVEEFLRFEPPFQRILRVVREPLELHGTSIEPGQTVMILLGSANRDPEAFDDPDTFNLHRATNRHVSFGYGVHFCLGAALARLEAPIALRGLLQRFADLRLDSDVTWHDGMVRGLTALHLTLVATRPPMR